MVTVKRQKKRSLHYHAALYMRIAELIIVIICVVGFILATNSRSVLQHRLDDLSDYMAKSIRTDLSQTLQTYETMNRKSVNLTEDVLPGMKRYMYSAYSMNRLLVESLGENYSLLDAASYNEFQTLVGEFERLLANGQSTAQVKISLGDYMTKLRSKVDTRFDSTDSLLPQTT